MSTDYSGDYSDEIKNAAIKIAQVLSGNGEDAADCVSIKKEGNNLIITIDSGKIEGADDRDFTDIVSSAEKSLEEKGINVERKDPREATLDTKPSLTITAPNSFDTIKNINEAFLNFVVKQKASEVSSKLGTIKNELTEYLKKFFIGTKLNLAVEKTLELNGIMPSKNQISKAS